MAYKRYKGSCFLDQKDGLTVEPASDSERKWVRELQLVLNKRPERLELVTVDASLQILDKEAAKHSQNFSADGVVVATVSGGPRVHKRSDPCPDSTLHHEFHLRPDVAIKISLPSDLTRAEADRITRLIQALPFA